MAQSICNGGLLVHLEGAQAYQYQSKASPEVHNYYNVVLQLNIALCIMKSQISGSYCDSGIESVQEFCVGKSCSPANLLHLRRFFLSKELSKNKLGFENIIS